MTKRSDHLTATQLQGLQSNDEAEVCRALVAAALRDPDWRWVEAILNTLTENLVPEVRAAVQNAGDDFETFLDGDQPANGGSRRSLNVFGTLSLDSTSSCSSWPRSLRG